MRKTCSRADFRIIFYLDLLQIPYYTKSMAALSNVSKQGWPPRYISIFTLSEIYKLKVIIERNIFVAKDNKW